MSPRSLRLIIAVLIGLLVASFYSRCSVTFRVVEVAPDYGVVL